MKDTIGKASNIKKKPARRKFIIVAVIFLCILTGYIYKVVTWESEPDPASEKIIRQIIAANLHKDPNELTDDDFLQIKELQIYDFNSRSIIITNAQLSDIKLLGKCKNLQLFFLRAGLPQSAKPKWKKVLAKFGVFDRNNKYSIDLSPLKELSYLQELTLAFNHPSLTNLTNLRTLTILDRSVSNLKSIKGLTKLETLKLDNSQVSDLEAIKGLKNLQYLSLSRNPISDLEPINGLTKLKTLKLDSTQVSDLRPLKGLTKLETLWLYDTQVADIEPIRELKNLVQLDIRFTEVSNLEPLKELTNLESLSISQTKVSDLEPLKELKKIRRLELYETPVSNLQCLENLKNLNQLYIRKCPNITDEQVKQLQKALPNLEIAR